MTGHGQTDRRTDGNEPFFYALSSWVRGSRTFSVSIVLRYTPHSLFIFGTDGHVHFLPPCAQYNNDRKSGDHPSLLFVLS